MMTAYEEGCYGDSAFGAEHCICYIEECAIEFLNRDFSDDDHVWGYKDGDFGYWRTQYAEEN